MSSYVRHIKNFDKKLNPKLSRIDIELTERCNNNCVHCYINLHENDAESKMKEMSTEFVCDVLDQAYELGCLSVKFTGGEPLLRDDFEEIYKYSRKLGMKVTLYTNGRLITPQLAELFRRIPPLKPIEISLYGFDEPSYYSVTGVRNAFEEVWESLEILNEFNIEYLVKGALLPQNKQFVDDIDKIILQNNIGIQEKFAYVLNYDLRARRDDEVKNSNIKKFRLTPNETLQFLTRNNKDLYIKDKREFMASFLGKETEIIFSCDAGKKVAVDAYGYAQPCLLIRHPSTIFSLDRKNFTENYSEYSSSPMRYVLDVFFPALRLKKSKNPDYLRRCAKCFLKGFCEQCPAKSWMEFGTLDTPVDYLCQVAHAQAEFLGIILEGENAWELAPEVWKKRLEKFITGQS